MSAAAAFCATCAVPRALSFALWHRYRKTIVDGASARRWEFFLAAAGLPFALSIGLAALASLPHSDGCWDTVAGIIAVGYAAAMTVSVGYRPIVSTAHAILSIGPMLIGCALTLEASHMMLAVMLGLLLLVLRSNSVTVCDAVVDRTALQQEAHASARTDALTRLPNRLAFDERIATVSDSEQLALILLDLDGFKDVNDTFGHEAGDALLTEIARRLRHQLIEGETAYRLGGDEFAILVRTERAEAIAETLIAACRAPMFNDGAVLRLGASAGIAVASADRLRQAADFALYAAKREGRNCWRRAPASMPMRLVA